MRFPVDKICRDVRIAIDENIVSHSLLETGDVDTLTLNDLILSKIEDGVRRVEQTAPVHFLEEGHAFGDNLRWGEMESGWILLPDDFMRLIVFKMSDWERAVYEALTAENPLYRVQSSRHKGLRGTAQRPVCALISRPEGRVLEFYSCKSDKATVERAMYLPWPRIDNEGAIDICERCYNNAVYMIASLALMAYSDGEKASVMAEMANSFI